MTDTDSIRFLAEELGIEFEEAEQRSALAVAMLDAAEALEASTNALMKGLTFSLERRTTDDRWQEARVVFEKDIDRFERARKDAVRFLYVHGGQAPEGHLAAVWDAAREANEETIADAASALREGTITRREFEERRAAVRQARATLDAAVDAELIKDGVIADA